MKKICLTIRYNYTRLVHTTLIALLSILLIGCGATGVPKGITPVDEFELERYLGTWYEIARLDHKFERDLQQVTATYTLLPSGKVQVENKGYSSTKKKWKNATGEARFVKDESTGHLKVSFFGPFYGSYIVFELDQQGYQYALVTGPNREYLWLLARQAKIEETLYDSLLSIAENNGFDVSKLIRVKH